MYHILTIDGDTVYLGKSDGSLRKVLLDQVSYPAQLGDKVDVYGSGDDILVVKSSLEALDKDKGVKSNLLQGILDIFLETLSIHNNHLGNIKTIFSQLLITLFMAWSLLGVIVIELLLFLEAVIVFFYRLLVKGLKAIQLGKRISTWFQNREKKADLKRQKEEAQAKLDLRIMELSVDEKAGDLAHSAVVTPEVSQSENVSQ